MNVNFIKNVFHLDCILQDASSAKNLFLKSNIYFLNGVQFLLSNTFYSKRDGKRSKDIVYPIKYSIKARVFHAALLSTLFYLSYKYRMNDSFRVFLLTSLGVLSVIKVSSNAYYYLNSKN